MNSKLTREQKICIYYNAKRSMERCTENDILPLGLCYHITQATEDINSFLLFDQNISLEVSPFPEVLKWKPKSLVYSNGNPNGSFWFPLDKRGAYKRIEILTQAIKELEG